MDIQLTLERGLFDLLARIAEDYGLDYEEMCDRYMSAPAPAKKSRSSTRPPRTGSPPKVCQGKTAKGQPCKKKACSGSDFCKTHEPKEATDSDTEEAPPKLCQGKTAKGQPCKKKACAGSDFCKTHEPLVSEGEEDDEESITAPKLCKGLTGKKKPCKKKACAGGDYCAAHTGEGPFKLPVSSSTKAAIHTHEPGETSEECDACSQYGDPVNSPAARREYRIVTRSVSKKVVEEDEEDMTEFAEKLQKELEAQGLLEEED